MGEDDHDDGQALHTIATVPPPEGESDAYNAATRVGPLAMAAVAEMMNLKEAEQERRPSARVQESSEHTAARVSEKPAAPARTTTPVPEKPAEMPRFFDEADGEASGETPRVPTGGRSPSFIDIPSFVDGADDTGRRSDLGSNGAEGSALADAPADDAASPLASAPQPKSARWDWWAIGFILFVTAIALTFLRK